ncbi:hypothetical protein X727_10810 [Mesorhizobium sp. L103C119B0]|nr:hypothetical protein X727_10810 [Mesorhizobium sp. L103C119B0]
MFLFAATPVLIFIYFSLLDNRANRWEKSERNPLLYVYMALHLAVIIGIIVSFFELYIKD